MAAWLVVYHHYMQMFYEFKSDSLIGKIFSHRGGFGVDVFFVLSGFFMYLTANKENSGFIFFTKRLFRVAPTYWFYTFVLLLISQIFVNQFNFTSFTTSSIFSSLFFIPHNNPSGLGVYPFLTVGWTLNLEVSFYTILSLCILINKRNCILLCSLIVSSLPIALHLIKSDIVILHALKSQLMWQFICGFCVAILYSKIDLRNKHNTTIGVIFIIASIVFISGIIGYGTIQKTISATFLVIGFLFVNKIFDDEAWLVRTFVKLGDYSFSTYLSHIIIIGVFLHYFGNTLTALTEAGVLIGITVITYMISSLSFKWVENSKSVISLRDRIIATRKL